MPLRVVITGANSAVGQAILRLSSTRPEPMAVVAAVRSERALQDLPARFRDQAVRIAYNDSASLTAAFTGASAVIHLAGTLVERAGSTYEAANVDTTRAVATAAGQCGVGKLVFISAIGADAASRNRYWKTKGDAEVLTRACRCPHTILRAPLLLGPGTEGSKAILRHLSHATVTLPGGGRNRQQPLDVDDLAQASLLAASPDIARDRTLDLVGPVSLPDREILERGARLLGRDLRIRSIPITPLRWLLALRGLFASGGFTPDVVEVITADTHLDPLPAATALGLRLTGLDQMMTRSLSPQEQTAS